jgi:hypothetical protein
MEEVSMRSFASAIDEPMLFQIGDELPNLTGHTDNITEVKTSNQCARDNKVLPGDLYRGSYQLSAVSGQ